MNPSESNRTLFRGISRCNASRPMAMNGWVSIIMSIAAMLFCAINVQSQTSALPQDKQSLLATFNETRMTAATCGSKSFAAVQALIWDARLEAAAQELATGMATKNFFSHTAPDGSTPWSRVKKHGFMYVEVGELVDVTQPDLAGTIRSWLRNNDNCAMMMSGLYTHIGIAYVSNPKSKYKHYWVAVLGREQPPKSILPRDKSTTQQ